MAGPGRKLNSDTPAPPQKSSKPNKEAYVAPKRDQLTNEARRAADAALSRFQGNVSDDFNTSLRAIRVSTIRLLKIIAKQQFESFRLK